MTERSKIKVLRDYSLFHMGEPTTAEMMIGDCIEIQDPEGNKEKGLVSKFELIPANFKTKTNSLAFVQTIKESENEIVVRGYNTILKHFVEGEISFTGQGTFEKGTEDYDERKKVLKEIEKVHSQISTYSK